MNRCFAFVLLLLACGCGTTTPVGVNRLGVGPSYDQINRSSLNARSCSDHTLAVLHRYSLAETYRKDPAACVRELHGIACNDDRRDTLLALSEICFNYGKRGVKFKVNGERLGATSLHIAASVYAYLYLLGPGTEPPPTPFDRQFRVACDLYNRSLALAFLERRKQPAFDLQRVVLPVGTISIARGVSDIAVSTNAYETFTPADEFLVRGLSVRNRVGGLGAPLVASRKSRMDFPVGDASAATLFLQVKGGVRDLSAGTCTGSMSIYSPLSRHDVEIDGRRIPLETDMTAQLAYVLENPLLWSLGLKMFRLGQMPFPPGIYPVHPYEPGKIPVVLVHGTMSSPVWWAEMLNTLAADPRLRERFHFWLYLYDSGKPIIYSARNFQEALDATVKKFDPAGRDPALSNMVVIGHSQGGLLTRFVSTDTGEAIIRKVAGKSLDELKLAQKERDLVSRYAIFRPVPQVRRVVFISTPHRGSFLAGSLARSLARRFIRLPQEVLKTGTDLFQITQRIKLPGTLIDGIPTSIDSMAPENPMLIGLSELPVAPNVVAHSIISVKPDMQPPDGDDGVVKYASAHLAGVASEFVVPSAHSCQSHPLTIEEVRRILLEHLKATPGQAK